MSAAGSYTYTVSNTCGTDVASFTVNMTPILSAGTDNSATICAGSNIDLSTLLSGADAGGTWSSGPVVSAAGTYTYTVSNGCGTDVASFTVNVTPILSAGADNGATICAGSTIDLSTLLSGADAGGVWSSGPVVSAAGTYTYTVSNGCGTDVASFTISVTAILSAGTDNSATICAGSTIDLSTLLSGADAGGTWSSGPLVSAAGTYTYTVSNGCGTDVASFTIGVTPILSAGTDNSATICAGSTIDLSTLLSGADAGGTWSSGPVVSAAGTYTYTVSNGCGTDVASFAISVTPILSAGTDNSATICAGSTIDLSTLLSGADAGGTWSSGPMVSAAGTYTYTVSNGCGTDVASFTISVTPILSAGADNSATICAGSTIDLSTLLSGADAGGTWSSGPVVSATGTYTYTVSNGCGTDVASFTISVTPILSAGADNSATICAGSTIDLSTLLSGADAGGVWSSGPVVSAAGTYTYTVSNGCGTDVASFTISVTPILSAGTDNSATICAGSTIDLSTLLSGAAAGGTWSSGPVVSAAGLHLHRQQQLRHRRGQLHDQRDADPQRGHRQQCNDLRGFQHRPEHALERS
ncbi:MAG: hypothetical protein IPK99_14090 [Flavobacteriales bacterium]|nr:hypothetical protein [Flavobacteriales bacterium]